MPNTLDWLQTGISLSECQRKTPLDVIDTRILMMQALGLSRIQLITQSELQLDAQQATKLRALIARRFNGEPIAYLIGEREFYGLSFLVTPDVLIPRPDTELLVELALQHTSVNSRVLDMGTGSGAIAVALAHTRADWHVTATDVSATALAVAAANGARHAPPLMTQTTGQTTQQTNGQSRITFLQSDWYSACAGQRFHTIISNPPYIEKNDPHLSQGDLRFEPLVALTDQSDGLSNYRHIIAGAATHLEAHGWLLLEHGYNQSEQVQDLLRQHGFTAVKSWQDLSGIWRVSGGQISG
ncbi:MAG: peptide chain release factor N(5)-glutamine methyltransferase [Burkholderiaceae bacterium]|nr:peptide chain release factor N(5)-glutamine methyltransferase [Burkholderiaceae bacterium]